MNFTKKVREFVQGIRDSCQFRFVWTLIKRFPAMRSVIMESQRVQFYIFCLQFASTYIIQPVFDWCWGPMSAASWFMFLAYWILYAYVYIFIEACIFIMVGWKMMDVNRQFVMLTAKDVYQSRAKEKEMEKRGERGETTHQTLSRLWESLLQAMYLGIFEGCKFVAYTCFTRAFYAGFYWGLDRELFLVRAFSFIGLSILLSIQIFDQAFVQMSTRSLSRIYDHYFWYFVGFGSWLSAFVLLLPMAFHMKVILVTWIYPWLLCMSLNSKIQPSVNLNRLSFGLEHFLEVFASILSIVFRFATHFRLFRIVYPLSILYLQAVKPMVYLTGMVTCSIFVLRVLLRMVT
jgi:hypothetical protein